MITWKALTWLVFAVPNDIDVQVLTPAPKPALIILVHRDVTELNVALRDATERPLKRRFRDVRAGQKLSMELPAGRFSGNINALFADGAQGAMPLTFTTETLTPLRVHVSEQHEVKVSRPVVACRYTATFDGKEPVSSTVAISENLTGTIAIDEGVVLLKLDVECEDKDGVLGGMTLWPWRLEVPHEEVHFKSGSADIEASEITKLRNAADYVRTAVRRYGELLPLSLYIMGYTDTVGTSADNLRLSAHRARAIALQLQRQGVSVPIHYIGFGESELAVKTTDETDDPRNRRVRYVIAVEPPERGKWSQIASNSEKVKT